MTNGPGSLLRSIDPREAARQDSATDVSIAVLYVPAQARDRGVVRDRLTRAGATVSQAADVPDALHMLGGRRYGLILVDLATARSAAATVRLFRSQFPDIPVVGVMDPSQPLIACDAIHGGAVDLLPWPFDERDAHAMLASARDTLAVDLDGKVDTCDGLFMLSAAMREVADAIRRAALKKVAVIVCGESGTGRELIARTLHARDDEYVTRPFLRVDCADESPVGLERRLFGATDRLSDVRVPGLERVTTASAVVQAQGGSLYLTHVADAPDRVQARLARLLRDREAFSIDAGEAIPLAVRVIAACAPDIEATVADGRLRRDLFDRLASVRIDAPPLSRRTEDVPLLAALFLKQTCEAERVGRKRFSRSALALLASLPLKGHAHELRQIVAASVRGTRHPVIQLDDVLAHAVFSSSPAAPADASLTLRQARARFERECISATLMKSHGRVDDAAKALGIQRTNLYRKIRQLNVPRSLLSTRK